MSYTICKTFEIESGHILSKHLDKCRFPHGHTRKVECVFAAASLDERDMVFDFSQIKGMLADFLERYDHALCMNTEDKQYAFFKETYGERVIGFEKQDPTTEVMAKTLYDTLEGALEREKTEENAVRACVRLRSVRVWETSSTWAEYRKD